VEGSQIALVIGGGRRGGIGHACSLALARDGARIVVADLDPAHAEQTVEDIIVAGGEAIACTTDVRVEADIEAAVQQAVAAFGRLDILVNNVGLSHGDDRDLREMTTDLWDEVMAVNVRGVMLGCKHAAPEMLRHHQHLVDEQPLRPDLATRLCDLEGGDQRPHTRCCHPVRQAGHPVQRRGARHDRHAGL
jgi:NAD(P)-dependent dehydrogenase (short-subunit alcohol dehydrogenase family)